MATEKRFLLDFNIPMAPGDTLMVSALVRDLKLTYGDRYEIGVHSRFPGVWRHNPYLVPLKRGERGVQTLMLNYTPEMEAMQAGRRCHYVTTFHRTFARLTGIPVPCLHPKGDLHLSAEEKATPLISGRYWIIVPGGKTDMTNKIWPQERYQAVVDQLRPWGLYFVEEGAVKRYHTHPPLNNVLNCVGLTGQRDLIVNIYHAEGVICGVSFPMHIAGALDKPCVVVAGGREEPWWEAYVNDFQAFGPDCAPVRMPHEFLHTLGHLPCCQQRGCWKRRVTPLKDNHAKYDESLCLQPIQVAGRPVPSCLTEITPDHVAEAVMRYYTQGRLPMNAIQAPAGTYANPPDGQLPPICPNCGASLGHFYQSPPPAPPESPPGAMAEPLLRSEASQAQSCPDPLAMPEPRFLRPTELIQVGEQKAPLPPGIVAGTEPPTVVAAEHPTARRLTVLNDPKLGGKMTICVLLYGNEIHYHRRCLTSIMATVPPSRLDLRVATNQVGMETRNLLRTLPITKVYADNTRRRKYPAMREMFWDPDCPITTPWLCWFDDDTHVRPEAAGWLQLLTEKILACPDPHLGMLGIQKYHPLKIAPNKDPRPWFTSAPWHQGKMFRTAQQVPAPNGTCIHFCVGWFWALKTEAMRACDIPDLRLGHNGGDVTIGEQLYQGGYSLLEFNTEKAYIFTPPDGRRGYRETFPFYR